MQTGASVIQLQEKDGEETISVIPHEVGQLLCPDYIGGEYVLCPRDCYQKTKSDCIVQLEEGDVVKFHFVPDSFNKDFSVTEDTEAVHDYGEGLIPIKDGISGEINIHYRTLLHYFMERRKKSPNLPPMYLEVVRINDHNISAGC